PTSAIRAAIRTSNWASRALPKPPPRRWPGCGQRCWRWADGSNRRSDGGCPASDRPNPGGAPGGWPSGLRPRPENPCHLMYFFIIWKNGALQQSGSMARLSPSSVSSSHSVSSLANATGDHGAVTIQVLDRAMRILDVLAGQRDPVTLKELSAATGLHASTAHRILADLTVGRYVERVDSGLYRLGMRLLELGSLVKGRLDVRTAAIGPMRELHRQTGQTVNLS